MRIPPKNKRLSNMKNKKRNNKVVVVRGSRYDGGRRINIDSRPPAFTSIPWYNLTVRFIDPPASITTVTLQAAISTQLGISFTASIANVRLQSFRMWGALGSTLQPLSVNVFDPIVTATTLANNTNCVLEALTDYPDQVRRAAVGYIYPKAQRETSLTLGNTGPATLIQILGGGPNSVAYFRVQWRPFSVTPPPVTTLQEEDFEDDYDDLVDRLARTTLRRDENGIIRTLPKHPSSRASNA